MLKRVLQAVCFMIIGPVIGFWVVASTFMHGGDAGPPSILAILFAAWLIFCLPIIGLKMAWWATTVAVKRRIEREVDLSFVSNNGRRIRQARARSW